MRRDSLVFARDLNGFVRRGDGLVSQRYELPRPRSSTCVADPASTIGATPRRLRWDIKVRATEKVLDLAAASRRSEQRTALIVATVPQDERQRNSLVH